ncbi:MAG TPA: hypothetical protein VGI66_12160 [Streptosporangiaceae bacterium]
MLTAHYVRRATQEVSTTLWAWNWESTRWLRSVFTTVTPLDDLPEAPEDPGLYRP